MFGENYLLIETINARGRRVEQWIAEAPTLNVHQLEDPSLLELAGGCNTDKDKFSRKTKIAGVNVVTFPCGIILSIEELFGSESLSQVLLPIYSLMKIQTIREQVQGKETIPTGQRCVRTVSTCVLNLALNLFHALEMI